MKNAPDDMLQNVYSSVSVILASVSGNISEFEGWIYNV